MPAAANSISPSAQKLLWSPQPGPQTALIACPVFEVFFGGARGGGKTEASLGDWMQHSDLYKESAIGLFVRRKLTELVEVIARSKQLFTPLGGKYNEQKKEWTMPSGGRLRFAYLERDADAEAYQGHSYSRLYIEELCNFPSPAPVNKLRATLRSAAGVPVGMRLTGNPGGPGHNWVKARYIDPCPTGWQVIREETEIEVFGVKSLIELDRVFIPSKVTDNQLLLQNDPTYVLRLKQSGSEQLVRAWLEGDWSVIDGAFFSELDPRIHVIPARVLDPWLKANPQALRFRSFDWGSARPFAVYWFVLMEKDTRIGEDWHIPKGALVTYREWYGASGPNQGLKMTVDAVAKGIRLREMGERIRYGAADPAIFIRDGGPSIGETMSVHGVTWRRADNKRVAGWEQLRQRLVGIDGKPMIYFSDSCEDLLRTLPVLQHDEDKLEDLDTEGEDHAADSIRYGVMSRPFIPPLPQVLSSSMPKLPNEMTIGDLLERRKALRVEREEWGE